MTAGPESECLRRATLYRARDRSRTAETRRRLGSREPDAAQAACAQAKEYDRLESQDLDFLARISLRVIDPDLKHGKTLLELFSTWPGTVSGSKFGFESAVYFKRETRGRQFTVGCNHFFPFCVVRLLGLMGWRESPK